MEKEIQDKILKISKEFNLKLMILFGSRSKKTNKLDSDYDFAFLPTKLNTEEEIKLIEKFETIFKEKKFDLLNLNNNHSIILRQEIFQNGTLLYENEKNLFEKIKENTYIDYLDSKILLEPTKEKFLKGEI